MAKNGSILLAIDTKKEILKLSHREMLKLTHWTETQSKIIEQTEILVMTTGIAELNIHLPPFSINGKKQYFLLNKVPVISFEQEITGVISTLINITEFKREVYFLKYILNKLPGSIYWKDNNGVYLGCNEFVFNMAGNKDVIGKTDFDMPWKEYAQEIRRIDKTVIDTKKMQIICY